VLSGGQADSDFECATCYQRHMKLGAANRRRSSVKFMTDRLTAALQSHVNAIKLHAQKNPADPGVDGGGRKYQDEMTNEPMLASAASSSMPLFGAV